MVSVYHTTNLFDVWLHWEMTIYTRDNIEIPTAIIILPTYVGEYIVIVLKNFLDRLSRFDDVLSNATVRIYR